MLVSNGCELLELEECYSKEKKSVRQQGTPAREEKSHDVGRHSFPYWLQTFTGRLIDTPPDVPDAAGDSTRTSPNLSDGEGDPEHRAFS